MEVMPLWQTVNMAGIGKYRFTSQRRSAVEH